MDQLMATGEMVSISIMSMAIEALGGKSISLSGPQAGIAVEGPYGQSSVKDINKDNIISNLESGNIVIVAGFQGIGGNGDIFTLGRGGSDVSAAALAAEFNCPCYIYTDVDGIHTVDPHHYPGARKLEQISYDDALTMAAHGAKVMEPVAVKLAKEANIPVYVKRTLSNEPGTVITSRCNNQPSVVGMAIYKDLCLAYCKQKPGTPLQKCLLETLEIAHIPTLFTKEEKESVVIGIKQADLSYANKVLPQVGLNVDERMEMITIVHGGGDKLETCLRTILRDKGCEPYHVEPGNGRISFIIEESQSPVVVNAFGTWLDL
ncbi:MAG: hypothetical protein GXZ11_07155 [Tissierellia bacterium]|nr:hypothetical protein [Tissierellia bacterium]